MWSVCVCVCGISYTVVKPGSFYVCPVIFCATHRTKAYSALSEPLEDYVNMSGLRVHTTGAEKMDLER